MNSDPYIEIVLDSTKEIEDRFSIKSNVADERIMSLLECVVRNDVGAGVDNSPRNEQSAYTVRIDWDLSNDSYVTTSDTGNKSLTTGIVMYAMKLLGE
jgi:hypothetical protein